MTIYAIGDIHGHNDQLQRALAWIEADGGADAPVVMLGDLVDRGPDSRGVIDTLIAGIERGRNWTVLLGNHDRLFLDFATEGRIHSPLIKSGRSWLDPALGGLATLTSYGIDTEQPLSALVEAARAAVPRAHLDFLTARPLHHLAGPLLFVHAGVLPGTPLAQQTEDALTWIREPFLSHRDPFDWLVVHGHTALPAPRHHGNRVNLDGGAGYGRPLTAAAFEGTEVFLLGAQGRTPLPVRPD